MKSSTERSHSLHRLPHLMAPYPHDNVVVFWSSLGSMLLLSLQDSKVVLFSFHLLNIILGNRLFHLS
jgi:hypothetical protein